MRRVWISMVVVMFSLLWLGTAAADEYMEGVEYSRITKPLRTVTKPGLVEVREYFWYGCPHCYNLEPSLHAWLNSNPSGVNFQMQPAILGEHWTPAAQVFYTAAQLGVLDRIHPALFDRIHRQGERILATDKDAMEELFIQFGVSPEQFDQVWASFGTRVRVNQAVQMTRQSGIEGVPAIVVNGKYRVDAGSAGGIDNMFKVIEYLVAKEISGEP